MADDQVVARAHIRAKARRAFDRGVSRDAHGFNPGAAAIFDWLEEYDRCAANSHYADRTPKRVDLAQVAP